MHYSFLIYNYQKIGALRFFTRIRGNVDEIAIAENIGYAVPDADMDEIVDALAAAGFAYDETVNQFR